MCVWYDEFLALVYLNGKNKYQNKDKKKKNCAKKEVYK